MYDLTFNLEQGKTYACNLIFKRNVTITGGPERMDAPPPLEAVVGMDWQVAKNAGPQDKDIKISMTIKSLSFSMGGPGRPLQPEVLAKLMGSQLEMTVSPSGEIKSFTGLDLQFQDLEQDKALFRKNEGALIPLRLQLSDEPLKNALALAFNFAPGKDKSAAAAKNSRAAMMSVMKKTGDTWDKPAVDVDALGGMVPVALKYKLDKLKQGTDFAFVLFGGSGDVSGQQEAVADAVGGLLPPRARRNATVEMTGMDVRGYVVFNTKEKDLEEVKARISSKIKISSQGRRKGSSMEADVEIVREAVLSLSQKAEK